MNHTIILAFLAGGLATVMLGVMLDSIIRGLRRGRGRRDRERAQFSTRRVTCATCYSVPCICDRVAVMQGSSATQR